MIKYILPSLLILCLPLVGADKEKTAEPKPLLDKKLNEKSLLPNSDFEQGLNGWQIWGYDLKGHAHLGGPIEGVGDIKIVPSDGDLLGGKNMCYIPKAPVYLGVTTKKTYDFKVGEVYQMVVTLKGSHSSVWDVLGRSHHINLLLDWSVAGSGTANTEYKLLELSAKTDGKWTRIDKIVRIKTKNFTGRPMLTFLAGDMKVDNFILIKRN